MKTFTLLFSYILAALLFCGCPYESLVPIYTKNHIFDKNLLGDYESYDGSGKIISVAATHNSKGEELYVIKFNTDEKLPVEDWEAEICPVSGTDYIEFFHPNDSSVVYHIFKIVTGKKKVHGVETPYVELTAMSKEYNHPHPRFPDDLRDFIKAYQHESGFFDMNDVERYYKKM